MDIGILNMIMLSVFPFLIGAAMRYGVHKWDYPLLSVSFLIFLFILFFIVRRGVFFSGRNLSSQQLKIYIILAVFWILGALAMDLIYRIRKKH